MFRIEYYKHRWGETVAHYKNKREDAYTLMDAMVENGNKNSSVRHVEKDFVKFANGDTVKVSHPLSRALPEYYG